MYSVEIRVMNEQGEQEGDLLSVIFDTLEEATGAARTAFETRLKDCPEQNTDNSRIAPGMVQFRWKQRRVSD